MRNGNSSITFGAIAFAGALLAVAACADAQRDYDKFRQDTAALRDAAASYVKDSGPPPEASIPTTEVKGTYIALCHIKSLYATDYEKTLRFATEVNFKPGAGGAGGTLDISLKPIKAKLNGDLNYDIAVVSSEPGPFKGSSPVGAADGSFEIKTDAAGKKLAADTNTIGAAADINEISLKGYATDLKKGFCALINADTSFLKLPYADNNVCLFVPAEAGKQLSPVPKTAADFKCP